MRIFLIAMLQRLQDQDPRHVGAGTILAIGVLVNPLNDLVRQRDPYDLLPLSMVILRHKS